MIRAQQLIDGLFEARRKKAPIKQAPAAPTDQPLMNQDEIQAFVLTTLGYGDFIKMLDYIERYDLYTSGKVYRSNNHYVHYNTIDFEWEVESNRDDIPPEQQVEIDSLATTIQAKVEEEAKDISKKIYRALESEWDYQLSDEVVDDGIATNWEDETYDEYGGEGGEFTWDQLGDSAKDKVRERWRENIYRDPDTFWSECTIDEWKEELEGMGFGDPEIAWSGFSSQGDGASFTCSSFDVKKFAVFFMSGKDKERGHPYTDELYAKEYAANQPPVAESEHGIDLEQFTRDSIYNDFSVIGKHDPMHQGHSRPWEKRYVAQKSARDNKFYVLMNIFDAVRPEDDGSVSVDLTAESWEDTSDFRRKKAGSVRRSVRFYVPPGTKSSLIAALMDYWENAKVIVERRNAQGRLEDPQHMCNSLAHRLSALAGIWKREHQLAYQAHLNQLADKWAAENPES